MTALIHAITSIAGRDGIQEAEAAFRVITKSHHVALPARSWARVASAIAVSSAADLMVSS